MRITENVERALSTGLDYNGVASAYDVEETDEDYWRLE